MNTEYEILFKLALDMTSSAYAPYSKFHVGAALLTVDNKIFTGCNIENSSFSLTSCAERVAFFKAVSDGYTEFKALAIAGFSKSNPSSIHNPCVPCGSCLQVVSEFCKDDFKIILSDGIYTLGDFLPKRFNL